MKITTLFPLTAGLALGYLLGSFTGRAPYEQVAKTATGLAQHPAVQQGVFNLAERARSYSSRLPGPASDVVDAAGARVQETLTEPEDAS